jgi:hypothetical protein
MFARGFFSPSTPHPPATAQDSANSNYSRTYAPFNRNPNHSRTYAHPPGGGELPPCNLTPRYSPNPSTTAAIAPLSLLFPLHPRDTSATPLFPLHPQKQGVSPTKKCRRADIRDFSPAISYFFPVPVAQAFLPVQPIRQQPSIANSRLHEPQNTSDRFGTLGTSHSSFPPITSPPFPFPLRGLQCARTFPTRGE